jgi:hypothetical protein
MAPVFKGAVQLKTRMLQTIVNIRHFDDLPWDAMIRVSYVPLLDEAKSEILFWSSHIIEYNMSLLVESPPHFLAWSDASDMAVGGFIAELCGITNIATFTADNWLLSAPDLYEKISHCAQLQVDALPWSNREVVTRGSHDLHPEGVNQVILCHRNLDYAERATDSNERELLAALHVVLSCLLIFKNKVVTLHMDNQNAVVICTKGSPKPRLQAYASLIYKICYENKIILKPVWIPRDLNNVADFLSKEVDFEDYSVSMEFFQNVCSLLEKMPKVDLFADNKNSKVNSFFSLATCPGTMGVDAFNYNWAIYGVGWIFVSPRLIVRALNYLNSCKSRAVFLIPQWKTSHFYPFFASLLNTKYCAKKLVFSGKNCFLQGSDPSSYFGPDYNGNIEIWDINFAL